MSASAAIIEKIKKLLRLARSSNPHEAQLAMQRALELAAEHQIAVEGLNPDEQAKEKTITHQDRAPMSRINYDARYAAQICKRFFRVSVIEVQVLRILKGWPSSAWKLTFVGTTSDIEISLYVFGFLTKHFAYCWTKHRGRLRNRHAFVDGMFQGIFEKLKKAEAPAPERAVRGNELALQDRRNYVGALIGDTKEKIHGAPSADAKAAAWSGYIHGCNTNIAPALKPSTEPAPLALCS